MLAMAPDQVPTLEHYRRQGVERGVNGLEIWDGERVRREEPALSNGVVAGLHAPTAGVVNPYEVCFSLIESARVNGVEILVDSPVEGITRDGDGVFNLLAGQRVVHARFVVNAAGAVRQRGRPHGRRRQLPHPPPQRRGIPARQTAQGLVKRIIFPCPTPQSKGILVIPTYDGTLMVGPTAVFVEDKDERTTSAAGGDEIFSAVRRFVPGISERDCIAEFAGLRAVADGEDFIIGPSAQKGFINCAGIQSPGLTASPAIAERIAAILRDEGLEMAPDPAFQPRISKRVLFASLPLAEQVRLAAEDSRYGRIGCRCEQISEREIIDAIHAGARTLDGIKFRTRAGMGRCQGDSVVAEHAAAVVRTRPADDGDHQARRRFLDCLRPRGRRRGVITAELRHLEPHYDVVISGGGPAAWPPPSARASAAPRRSCWSTASARPAASSGNASTTASVCTISVRN